MECRRVHFRFSKDDVTDFHYKNLSGGEKAAFDILLDVFLKRDEGKEAVFCIDETGTACGDGSSGTAESRRSSDCFGRHRSCGSRRIRSESSGKHTRCW